MPVRKVSGAISGVQAERCTPLIAQAEAQGRAIYASGWSEKKGGRK